MQHDKRKLWTFMLNSLRPTEVEDESALLERLGCIRSAAKVVAVPPEDTVFRGQALLCVAKALAAEEDRQPLEALEESFRDILTESGTSQPSLGRLMPQWLQATWTARPLLREMGPNFSDTCHRALLTSSRPEPLTSAALLRTAWQLLHAGIRPSSSALLRSLALRATLAASSDTIDDAEEEAQEKTAALRVLTLLCGRAPQSMPKDLPGSLVEFLTGDQAFEEACVAKRLGKIREVSLCHQVYESCMQHLLDSPLKSRRLNLLTTLAVKTPGLALSHLELLRGHLKHPAHRLQGLRHLRRLLKAGLPKEDAQQVFLEAFQILKTGKSSRHFMAAAQLCADAVSNLDAWSVAQDKMIVADLLPFLAKSSSKPCEWMAISSLALNVCRLADQAAPGDSMHLFQELHSWILRCFEEHPRFRGRGRARPNCSQWLRRNIATMRQILRVWMGRSDLMQLLTLVLCQNSKPGAMELRWRLCVFEAAALEAPLVLATLRWPDMEPINEPTQANRCTWRPYPKELSTLALRWWQAIFHFLALQPTQDKVQNRAVALSQHFFRMQVLQGFRRYVASACALNRGRPLLLHLAALAGANGLLEDATKILQRCVSSFCSRERRWKQLLRFVSLQQTEERLSKGSSLLERVRDVLSKVKSASKGTTKLPANVTQELDHLACNPLFSDASRAALRTWKLLAQHLQLSNGSGQEVLPCLTDELQKACHEASPLALAQLKDLRNLQVMTAVEMLPLPRCVFGVYGDLEVRLKISSRGCKRPREVVIDGEPYLPRARRRHAKAIHEAWYSTDIVASRSEVSWTIPRQVPSQIRQDAVLPPPLAFRSQHVANGIRSVEVSFKSSLGIPLAFGMAEVTESDLSGTQ